MRDDEWQAAYNAGRESVADIAKAIGDISYMLNQLHGSDAARHDAIARAAKMARTALEKYRSGK